MKTAAERVITIRTPEGISFTLLLAGPIHRAFALIIDLLCIATLGSFFTYLLSALSMVSVDAARSLSALLTFLFGFGYFIVFEWLFRGQTLGKRLFKLRVLDDRGLRLTFSQVVLRTLFRTLDLFPLFYLVGGVSCIVNRHGKRIGDLVANTIVVRQPPVTEPDLDQISGGKFNSFWEYPHLVARYRQRVSPEEAQVALSAILRREEFEPTARIELFADIARHFQERYPPFPSEARTGLTDEQYLRNLVDILFRPKARHATVSFDHRPTR